MPLWHLIITILSKAVRKKRGVYGYNPDKTKDGVVILGGKVANIAEKCLTTRLVNDVHSVEKVVNTMTIEKTKNSHNTGETV
jgi:hypothetical protein